MATNFEAADVQSRVHMDVLYPNGATRHYSVLSKSFPALSSFQVQHVKRMKIPLAADAPAGTYTVTLRIGADILDGGAGYDTDVFTFDLPPLPISANGPGTTWLTTPEAGPNPFTSETTIRYQLATDAAVDLRVYDVTGREVASLASGVQGAGAHSAVFAAGDLPGGVYVWRLAVNGDVTTGRVTLTR